MLGEDNLIGPFERMSVVIAGSDEGVGLLAHLPRRDTANA